MLYSAASAVAQPPPTNLYTLMATKPYYSEFKALVDLLALNSTQYYPFAPTALNPLFSRAPATTRRTALLPNNYAVVQAYNALLARSRRTALCAFAATTNTCGHALPAGAASWLDARAELRASVLDNKAYLQVLVAGHVIKDAAALPLAALAPKLDEASAVVSKSTDSSDASPGGATLYFYSAR